MRNRIYGVKHGIWLSGVILSLIVNNVFTDQGGLRISTEDSILVSNNLFYHTDEGIWSSYPLGGVNVRNNIFLSNTYGILQENASNPFINLHYNNFFDNDTDFVNCAPDSTNLYFDPIVQDTLNFRLSLGSPCIDAGDPDPFFNDMDSTRNDIGCWGGPWGESYPYAPVLSHQTKPLPTEFSLLPLYPNPFNSILVIPFTIPVQKEVIITIYNILGQKVQEFTFPPLSPGARSSGLEFRWTCIGDLFCAYDCEWSRI